MMADKIREDVAAIVQAAQDVDADARDRDATARLTAAASRLRVHAAHLLRLASTPPPGADRPRDRIREGHFPPRRAERHEIEHDKGDEPL